MVISCPEGGGDPDAGPDHADGVDSEGDVSGCASDEPPSAEVGESLMRSGVPESETSAAVSSAIGEIGEDPHGLNTCTSVVSCDDSSRELLCKFGGTLSPKAVSPFPGSLVGRLVAAQLIPAGRGGIGGTREFPLSLLLSLEEVRAGEPVKGLSPAGRVAESIRVIRRDTRWSRGWSVWSVHTFAMRVPGSVVPEIADALSSTTGDSPGYVERGRGSADLRTDRRIWTLDAWAEGILIGAGVTRAARREPGV
jgi:hypothetical protein